MKMALIVCLILFFEYLCICFCQPAPEAPNYIIVDGVYGEDSSTCGNSDHPCKTIQYGINVCPVQGTVYLRPMVYTGVGNVNLTISRKEVTLTKANTTFYNSSFPEVVIDCEERINTLAISIYGDLHQVQISDIHFQRCTSLGSIQASGVSTLVIRNSVFTDSISSAHGGAVLGDGIDNLEISDCVFRNNTGYAGGAVAMYGGTMTILLTAFLDNHANKGGAVHGYGSDVTIMDVDFDSNSAARKGNYLYTENAVLRIQNCTVMHTSCGAQTDVVCGGVCAYDGKCAVIGCAPAGEVSWKIFVGVVCGAVVIAILLSVFITRVVILRAKSKKDKQVRLPQSEVGQPEESEGRPPSSQSSAIMIVVPSVNESTETTPLLRQSGNTPVPHHLTSANGCKICYIRPYNTILLPCKHASTCGECADQLDKCPVCREPVTTRVGFYPS